MSSRRTLILIAAIAVGALAAFAIFSYVRGLEDEAFEGAQRVPVVQITGPIPQGTTGADAVAQGLLEPTEIPVQFLPEGAITDFDLITEKIAAADLATNAILVDGMFVDPQTSRVTQARRIPEGNVLVTIQVDQVRGVAGLITPGDYVNMMALYEDGCGGGTDTTTGEGGDDTGGATTEGESQSSAGVVPVGGVVDPTTGTPGEASAAAICTPAAMVYQDVQVLFVDRSATPTAGETTDDSGQTTVSNSGLLTLAVPPAAAQLIASIPGESWYLTLLPPDYVPVAVPDFDTFIELLPGENPNVLTPYGPTGFDPDTAQ